MAPLASGPPAPVTALPAALIAAADAETVVSIAPLAAVCCLAFVTGLACKKIGPHSHRLKLIIVKKKY